MFSSLIDRYEFEAFAQGDSEKITSFAIQRSQMEPEHCWVRKLSDHDRTSDWLW